MWKDQIIPNSNSLLVMTNGITEVNLDLNLLYILAGDLTKQLRSSSRGLQQITKAHPSVRGSLLSPGDMSASSLPRYFSSGPVDKVHEGGPYRPEQFQPHHYEQIPHERPSRPRSKRLTATSQDLAPPSIRGQFKKFVCYVTP